MDGRGRSGKKGGDGRDGEGVLKALKRKGLRVGDRVGLKMGLRVEGEDVPKERGR